MENLTKSVQQSGQVRSGRVRSGQVMSHLHLRFRHAEGVGELGSLRPRQVLGLLESLLQGKNLLTRKCGPRVFLLAVLVKVAREV